MGKQFVRSLCRLLGLQCLLACLLFSIGWAQDSEPKAAAHSVRYSEVAPGTALSKAASRVLPNPTQQAIAAWQAKMKQTASRKTVSEVARPTDSGSQPGFGGFSGSAPLFQAALPIADPQSGYLAYDTFVTTAGDFNGDGNPDVVTIQKDGSINVLLGDGKGGFSAPVVTPASLGLGYFANATVADLNGDGKQDLVVLNGQILTVSIGNGDGTFAPPVTPVDPYPNSAIAFTIADGNGDGHPDILTVSDSGAAPDVIVVRALLNAGDGTFPAANVRTTTAPVPVGLKAVAFANTVRLVALNGTSTLVFEMQETPAAGGGPYSADLFLAASNGDGSFTFATAPVDVPSARGSSFDFGLSGAGAALWVQDLNNDGATDILIAPGDGYLYTALGTGSGFAAPIQASSNSLFLTPNFLVRDLDGDGTVDLLDAESEFTGVLHGNGDGTFSLVHAYASGAQASGSFGGAGWSTAYGDFNGDGRPDFVSVDNNYGVAAFHMGLGGLQFQGAAQLIDDGSTDQNPATPWQLLITAALDLDGDGKTDLVGFNEAGAELQAVTGINQGAGYFQWNVNTSIPSLPLLQLGISPVTGDFNRDGKQDLILYGVGKDYLWHVYTVLSNGNGTLANPVEVTIPNQNKTDGFDSLDQFAVADVNGDGNPDIVMTYGNPSAGFVEGTTGYYVALGDGTGKFPSVTFYPFGTNLDLVLLADFNGDGAPDLVLSNIPDGKTPSLMVLSNDGKGNFANSSPYAISLDVVPVVLLAGDVNQDGKTDLIMSTEGTYDANTYSIDYTKAGLWIYPGNGDGTVGVAAVQQAGEVSALALGDFNGDGLPDILTSLLADFHSTLPSIGDPYFGASLLLNSGNGTFAEPIKTLVPFGTGLLLSGNFYGDGVMDFLAVDRSGAGLYYNQGGSTLTLVASGSSIEQGDTVTLSAKVRASFPSQPVPTGNIVFRDGSAVLSTVALDGSGAAMYTTDALAVGTHALTATYAGDSHFNPATQTQVSITVQALSPAFDLAASATSATISRTGSTTLTLALTSNATFNGSVALSASGVPADVTVRFSPASVQLGSGQAANAKMTISAGKSTPASARGKLSPWMKHGAPAGFALLMLIGFPLRKYRRRWTMLMVVLSFATLAAATGCGSNSQQPKAGTVQITITAMPSGSTATAQSTTVSLTIQ